MSEPSICVRPVLYNNDKDSPLSITANAIALLTFAYVLFVGVWYQYKAMRQTPTEINRLETDILIFLRRIKTVADASLPSKKDEDLLISIAKEAHALCLEIRKCRLCIATDMIPSRPV